jgi:hypothetical protein
MSAMAEKARSKSREKAERLTRSSPGKVDASGWREPLGENAEVQTGMRPISRRQFRRGGKVHGEKSKMHAGRKPRAKGGALTATSLINRDVKDANESRVGTKHIGGMKKGGRAHKMVGGPMMGRPGMPVAQPMAGAGRMGAPMAGVRPGVRPYKKGGKVHGRDCKCCGGGAYADGGKIKSEFAANQAMQAARGTPAQGSTDYFSHMARSGTGTKTSPTPKPRKAGGSVSDGTLEGTRPQGGRLARARGGKAKGTNVNIIIAPGGGGPKPMPMGAPMGAGPNGPVGLHQGAPPPMAPPPGAAPPMGPPPMGRKSGGRTNYPIKDGAGGGKGRLEKIRAYG